MKIRNRIRVAKFKRYFTEKPKSDFWMWAFITLLLFRYVTPTMLLLLPMMQLGLIAPELTTTDMNLVFESASTKLTESFVGIMETLFESGKMINENNPLIAKIVFHGISYLVWVLWAAMLVLILNLCRYGISWIIRKVGVRSKE